MRHSILGVPIDALTCAETLDRITAMAKDGGCHQVITANPEMLDAAGKDVGFYELLTQADLVTADGNGVLLAGRLLGRPFPERVTGIELAEALCRESAARGLSLYFLGGRPGVAAQAMARMRERYPGSRIVGAWHGYFRGNEAHVFADIRANRPDILLCGLGSPFQERFIATHQKELGVPVAIGVGGSFDVLSGQVRRAPLPLQKMKLEWLYRIAKEPARWRRALALPRFVGKVLGEKFSR